ncbi:MAG: inositol monophosphatase family protein [Burkholderiaceae bacterium]
MNDPSRSALAPLHPMLAVAIEAAREAAALIRTAAADPASLQVREKHANDFVTQVDVACERLIVGRLLRAFPDHAVRGEESPRAHGNPAADHVWIVDPLDGTSNFIHGYPNYAVSIALSVRGRVEHGVVLDVPHDELFHASLGIGAFLGARRLQVAGREGLARGLVATSCPYRPGPAFEAGMRMLADVMQHSSGIRRSGSAALDLAAVAAGRCDAAFDLGLNAWDVAAGGLLVTEAGGCVGNFLGGPDFLETRECVAANATIFAELTALLRPYARERASP